MASQPERIVLTYQDLQDLPEDRNRYEIFEGELEVTAAPTPRHQTVVRRLLVLLDGYISAHDLGEVFDAPLDVKLSDISVVEPDLVYVAKARQEIIGERFIEGPPDLVVEVLSPSTASRDRRAKRGLYARHGVPHYWLFDLEEQSAVALKLVGHRYQQVVTASGEDVFSAPPFPDLAISLEQVFRDQFRRHGK